MKNIGRRLSLTLALLAGQSCIGHFVSGDGKMTLYGVLSQLTAESAGDRLSFSPAEQDIDGSPSVPLSGLVATKSIAIKPGARLSTAISVVGLCGSACLQGAEIAIGNNVLVTEEGTLRAHKIAADPKATVMGTVTANEIIPAGLPVFKGSIETPLQGVPNLPGFVQSAAGANDLDFKKPGSSASIPAGRYRNLIIGVDGKIELAGGEYVFDIIELKNRAHLVCKSQCNMAAKELRTHNDSELTAGSPRNFVLYLSDGAIVGNKARMIGQLYTVGDLVIGNMAKIKGIYIAKNIAVGANAVVEPYAGTFSGSALVLGAAIDAICNPAPCQGLAQESNHGFPLSMDEQALEQRVSIEVRPEQVAEHLTEMDNMLRGVTFGPAMNAEKFSESLIKEISIAPDELFFKKEYQLQALRGQTIARLVLLDKLITENATQGIVDATYLTAERTALIQYRRYIMDELGRRQKARALGTEMGIEALQ